MRIENQSKVNSFNDFISSNKFEIDDYLSNKELKDLSIHELVYIYLDCFLGKTKLKDCTVYSCLYDLVENNRASYSNVRTKIYTPLLGSFIILDQLGSIFSDISNPSQNGINIILNLFGYDEKTIKYLISLRNGLMHDGSLTSMAQYPNQYNTIFRLSPDLDKTIELSANDWDGVFQNDLSQYISKINSKSFFEDVLIIIELSKKELLNQKLSLRISSEIEFFYKFLFKRNATMQ